MSHQRKRPISSKSQGASHHKNRWWSTKVTWIILKGREKAVAIESVYYADSLPVCCDTLLWPWTQIRQNAAWVFFFHQRHMGHLFQMHLPFNLVTGTALQFLPQPLREKLYIFHRTSTVFIPLCMTSVQSSARPQALKFVSTVQSKMSYVKNYRCYIYTLFSSIEFHNISFDSTVNTWGKWVC